MIITQFAIVMTFGALVAVAGLALLYVRKEQGENKIKLFGQEFQISTPALVVFLAGCAIFVLPFVVPMQNQTVVSLWAGQPTDGPAPTPVTAAGEEREPNDKITEANVINMGRTIKGTISTDQDRDFFKFKTGQGMKTRVILRKTFDARLVIYDSAEERVTSRYAGGEDAVSFAFDNNASSFYYVLVESGGPGGRGPYELVIREE